MNKIYHDFTIGIELKRGFEIVEYFEDDGHHIIKWPRCHVGGCENGICVGKNKKFCHPHMFEKGMETIEELETTGTIGE